MANNRPDPLHTVEGAEAESNKKLADEKAAEKAAQERRREYERKAIERICYAHFNAENSKHLVTTKVNGRRGHPGFEPTNNPQPDAVGGLSFRSVGSTTGQFTDDTYKSKYESPLTKKHREIIVNRPKVTTMPIPRNLKEFKEAMWEVFSFMKKHGQDYVFVDFPSEKDVTMEKLKLIAEAAMEVGVYPSFKDAKTQSKIDAFLASQKTNEPVRLIPWTISPSEKIRLPNPFAVLRFVPIFGRIIGNAVVKERELVDWKGDPDRDQIAARKKFVEAEYKEVEKVWEKTSLNDRQEMEDVYYTKYKNELSQNTTGTEVEGANGLTDADIQMKNSIQGAAGSTKDLDAQYSALVEQGKQLENELAVIEDARALARDNANFYNERLSENSGVVATAMDKKHKDKIKSMLDLLSPKAEDLKRKRAAFETHLVRLEKAITDDKNAIKAKPDHDAALVDKLETQLDKIENLKNRQPEMKADLETFGEAAKDVQSSYRNIYAKAAEMLAPPAPAPGQGQSQSH